MGEQIIRKIDPYKYDKSRSFIPKTPEEEKEYQKNLTKKPFNATDISDECNSVKSKKDRKFDHKEYLKKAQLKDLDKDWKETDPKKTKIKESADYVPTEDELNLIRSTMDKMKKNKNSLKESKLRESNEAADEDFFNKTEYKEYLNELDEIMEEKAEEDVKNMLDNDVRNYRKKESYRKILIDDMLC